MSHPEAYTCGRMFNRPISKQDDGQLLLFAQRGMTMSDVAAAYGLDLEDVEAYLRRWRPMKYDWFLANAKAKAEAQATDSRPQGPSA